MAAKVDRTVPDRDSGFFSRFSGKTHIGYGNSYGNIQFGGQADKTLMTALGNCTA